MRKKIINKRNYPALCGIILLCACFSGGFDNTFRKYAENESLILLADDSGVIALENKSTGYTWYSSPPDEIISSNALRYGTPKKRSDTLLHSDDFTISSIPDGFRIVYSYSAGFSLPVDYVLNTDYLSASVKVSEIAETNPDNLATEVTIMEGFGASSGEDGYFVIPDGSGAIVRFSDVRNTYSNMIFGDNTAFVPTYDSPKSGQICLSAYGIVRNGNAVLVTASEGSSDSYVTTKTGICNTCSFSFILRNTDTFYMSGSSSDKFTVFETGDICADDIEVRYYPIAEKNADYIDIAEKYREYINITPKNTEPALYVNLYGGTEKKKSMFGIPVTAKKSATSYSQAVEILSGLKSNGADNIVASYVNWTDDSMENRIDTGAEPSRTLGGADDFSKLKKFADNNNISLFPAVHNRDFISGNGYNLSHGCIRASGAYSRIISYDRAHGIPDNRLKNKFLISPEYFDSIYTETARNYISRDLSGIFPQYLTSSLYGDYSRQKISRFRAMQYATEALKSLSESLDIVTDCANEYALPYVSHITDMPLSSGRSDVFSEDVPFMQIVLHGVIPYATVINSSPNPTETLLKAVAVGSMPCYDIIAEPVSSLSGTEADVYYYANFYDSAEKYASIKQIFADVAQSTITDYKSDGNKITTTYSNGTIIITDFDSQTVNFNGSEIYLGEE